MGGVFSRLRAVFQTRVNELTGLMEDPRASLNFAMLQLEEDYRKLSRSLIEITAVKQRLDDELLQLQADELKYDKQVEIAFREGRDDLARSIIERKQAVLERKPELDENSAALADQLASLKHYQAELNRKIASFRVKKEQLKSIYDSSRVELRLRESLSGISSDLAEVGNTVRRIEDQIQSMKSRSTAIEELVSEGVLVDVLGLALNDVDRQLEEMERDRWIEDELTRLKAQYSPG
jgi:phage shock protein A